MPSHEHLANARAAAARTRLARKQLTLLQTVLLDGGASVYQDSPPGVGWVLLSPTGHKRYYALKETALEQWATRWVTTEHSALAKAPRNAKGSPVGAQGNPMAVMVG